MTQADISAMEDSEPVIPFGFFIADTQLRPCRVCWEHDHTQLFMLQSLASAPRCYACASNPRQCLTCGTAAYCTANVTIPGLTDRVVCTDHVGPSHGYGYEFARCETCGGAVHRNATSHICNDGEVTHANCRSCGRLSPNLSPEHEGLCGRCFSVSQRCDCDEHEGDNPLVPRPQLIGATGPNGNQQFICSDCLENIYDTCSHCSIAYHWDLDGCDCAGANDDYDNCSCGSCYAIRRGRGGEPWHIRGYGYTPDLVFRGGADPDQGRRGSRRDHNLYLGFELEVGVNGSHDTYAAARATVEGFTVDGKPVVYLKEDSSIPDNGFEIVTHPATYDWWINSIDWPEAFSGMRDFGAFPDRSCGMHVHVSKAGFAGPAHEHRWLLFWHRNAKQLAVMARRNPSRWARFLPEDDSTRRNMKAIAQKKARGDSRYQAINTENDATYEVRVFASTTNSIKVRAALGLVDASVEYCRTLRAKDILKDSGWTWEAFRRWIEDPKRADRYRWTNQEITRLFGALSAEENDAYTVEGD